MLGDLNAIALILCVIATIAMIVRHGAGRCTSRRLLWSMAATLLLVVLAQGIKHACNRGQPFSQWAIPRVCMLGILTLVADRQVRRVGVTLMIIAAIGLSLQFTDLVHEPGYTGNPFARDRNTTHDLRRLEQLIQFRLAERDSSSLPAGWLRDIVPEIDDESQGRLDSLDAIAHSTPYWHTFFTGIHRKVLVPADVWYPGGSLAESGGRLELRERPR